MVSYVQNGTNGTQAYIYVNGAQIGMGYISAGTQGANCQLTAIVPPGATYSCSGNGINTWQELY
jgi:hypothetical protein